MYEKIQKDKKDILLLTFMLDRMEKLHVRWVVGQ